MADISFWKERVETYGHTGWCYPCTYGFDQRLRINAAGSLIEKFAASSKVLLDFGCGTGDFSWALRDRFQKLVLYDPCVEVLEKAREKFKGSNQVLTTSERRDLILPAPAWDVVLSITVLQHIMSDDELGSTLACLNRGMTEHGVLLVMETVSENIQSLHERSWSYDTFCGFMERAGFSLLSGYDFYTPSEENEIFKEYFNLPETTRLRKDKTISDQEKIKRYEKLAEKYVSNSDNFLSPLSTGNGSKFLIYTKKQESKE